MNVASRSACLALALAGCGNPAEPPALPPPPPAQTPAPATSREILVDLARWDAATTADRRAAAEDVARRLPDFALLRLETFSCGGQTHEVAIYRHARTEMEFVLVPGGTFLMGSPLTERSRANDELQHTVVLSRSVLVARTACTQAAYQRVVGKTPSSFKGADLPVEHVSWQDAKDCCDKADLALPTEAQWEYACRAGTTGRYCCGDSETALADFAWRREDADARTHPVGSRKPNAFGLHDMHGNVDEWCADGYDQYTSESVIDPVRELAGHLPVVRGGSWSLTPEFRRSAARFCLVATSREDFLGFRPAKTVPMD